MSILFASDDRNTQISTFFKFWTCKEAVLKANGTGFMKDPKCLEIDLNPTESSNKYSVYWYGSLEKHSVAWTENLSL
jgi:phosphopantetheinyl transferase